MNFLESLQSAISSIMANKMRSILTMLGIIIGISSVITIVSIGQGGKKFLTGQFESVGINNITVSVGGSTDGKAESKIETKDFITMKDVESIPKNISNVISVSVMKSTAGQVTAGKDTVNLSVTGGNLDAIKSSKIEMLYGRVLTENDILSGRKLIVVDNLFAKKIFKKEDAVGEKFKLVDYTGAVSSYLIVGVCKNSSEKYSSMFGREMYFGFTSIGAVSTGASDINFNEIIVTVTEKKYKEQASKDIVNYLEKVHKNKGKYSVKDAMEMLNQFNKALDMLTLGVSVIAGISLFVGGIGVMNIMLVSVTERTREIGIRKAIGAKRRDIKMQFLTESVILCLIGGLLGMSLGMLFGKIAGHFLKMPIPISIEIIAISVGFSSAIGIFFGLYPASQASKLDPIEALRYD